MQKQLTNQEEILAKIDQLTTELDKAKEALTELVHQLPRLGVKLDVDSPLEEFYHD